MENKNNKKKVGGAGSSASSSSSTTNFDHLFALKDPSNNIFNSIFPPPST
ncbi:hypothetical protein A2U01_0097170, partial [Trifolium medium]|nr:hypothetical protein [Trifolium medium]